MSGAWLDDYESYKLVMRVFERYTHYWFKLPGKSEAQPACIGDGLKARSAVELRDPNPTCPGCQRFLRGGT